jgi:hypothetical protein
LVFVDTCENLIVMSDVATFSNPPVTPVEEEFEEALLDVNFSQWSHEKKIV